MGNAMCLIIDHTSIFKVPIQYLRMVIINLDYSMIEAPRWIH